MSQAILNEKLEEAITRCGELNDEMAETTQAVEALLSGADEVSDKIASAGDEAHQDAQELTTELEHVQDALQAAGAKAQAQLTALASASEETKANAGKLIEKIGAELDQLEQHKDELLQALDGKLQESAAETSALGEAVSQLQERIGTHLDEAGAAIDAFSEALLAARQEWDDKKLAVLDAVGELEEAVGDRVEACTQAVEALLEGHKTALADELANHVLVDAHNGAIEALGQKLEEEAPQKLESALGPLRDAMAQLGETCSEGQDGVEAHAQQVMAKVQAALSLVERLVPSFDATERLE